MALYIFPRKIKLPIFYYRPQAERDMLRSDLRASRVFVSASRDASSVLRAH